ncbi:MAG: PDZ domain-containing protein, partial [Phycisphaerales bacterium]|nr:PDZ domain-containing protein [Phycisphaerales bacterium]
GIVEARPAQPGTNGAFGPRPSFAAPADSIEPYIALFDAEDYAARQNAAEFIMTTRSVELGTLLPHLRRDNLSPEARSRLNNIASLIFRVTPRAAMGVQFDRSSGGPVIISAVVETPLFRAHEVLEAGDQVLEADGTPIRTYDEFQAAILSHDPYGAMRLAIRRRGEIKRVIVPLGDFMRLGTAMMPTDQILEQAWERRIARELGEAAASLTPSLDLRELRGQPVRPERDDGDKDDGGVRVIAGGDSRGGLDQDGVPIAAIELPEDERLRRSIRESLLQQGWAEADIANAERQLQPILERRDTLLAQRARLQQSIDSFLVLLRDQSQDPAVRQQARQRVEVLRQQLAQIEISLETLQAMLPAQQR